MEPKRRGWNEGVLTEDIRCFGNHQYRKGDRVRYKRIRSVPDRDGYKATEYEWHYLDLNNYNLVRTTRRLIEGLPFIQEPYIDRKNRKP